MRIITFLILWVSIVPAVGYAQGLATYQDLINVGTQPPDAASLGKFGNIPVNYNTGSTSITIPIFEINVGKTKLPISLDYHTGGIRVDETSSMVGIGWALSGIGEIARNVVGLPDEAPSCYLSSPPFDSLYTDWSSAGGAYGSTINGQYASFLNNFRIGAGETEPDIYSYTINGASGKFIFRKDGTFMQFPLSNNVITQSGGFRIVDPQGTVYIFDLVEHTNIPAQAVSPFFANRWRLSKMIDPNTVDTIFFKYANACNINVENYYSYSYTLGYGPNCESFTSPTAIDYEGEHFSISTIEHTDELFPSEIDWRGGKITFQNACDRLDKGSEQRLNSVNVYSNLKNGYQLVKTVQLYQSYFYSDLTGDSAHDERNYRLRLDSVSYLPVTGIGQSETYRMIYNTAVPMASRESMAQDQWGFNNGQFNNYTSMPAQTVLYNNVYYSIGEANRRSDSLSMLSCSIQSVQYPTGGKSVFELEPHRYLTNFDSIAPKQVSCDAYGGEQTSSQITFTPDSNGANYNIVYTFSSYNYTGVTDRPNITITDQTTGTQILLSSNIDASESLNNTANPTPWSPILGHTYLIVTNIYTTTATQVSATLTISWGDTYNNVNEIGLAGGLRVKTITNYDANGAFIGKEIYNYGVDESGVGQLVTPSTYLLVTDQITSYKCGFVGGTTGCDLVQGNPGVTYYANSVYAASQFSGSTILYPSVTKYEVDSLGHPNGKSTYAYSVFDDQSGFASTNYAKTGVLLITDLWRNGYLGYQLDYKYNAASGSYQLIHQKVNNYGAARQQTMNGLKLHNNYNWNTSQCYEENMAEANLDYLVVQIPINSGAMLLQSASDSTYDDAGHVVGATITYSYNDTTHLFPTTEAKIDSKNNPRVTNLRYPHDFSSSVPVYANMLSRNIISPVVQTQETYSGVQTRLQNVNYSDWRGNSTLFEPSTVDEQTGSFPLETRIRFNSFDKYGNIIQQQKISNVYQSYVWDYDSTYPIAKVTNADTGSIAYTSFEADGTGNWTIGSGTVDTTTAITGRNSYNLSGSISKTGLNSGTTYIVSYWTQNSSAFSIAGTISGYPVKGKTISINNNSWTLYVHKVTGQTTITVSGSGHIDELRLYPATAQMTTYTYSPLVGVTSQTDVGNRVTYYEYDGLARLKRIRDQDYNILKTYEYQYQATAGCGSGCYILGMQTLAGTGTLSYPVGVFDVHGNLVGNAATQSAYVSLWNSDTADTRIGTLAAGPDSMHFNFTLNAGQTALAGVTGCRYFQYDLPWNVLDGVTSNNGAYVAFGDGTGMQIPKTYADTPAVTPPNTTRVGFFDPYDQVWWFIHSYPDTSTKTITFYHNDDAKAPDLDNGNSPATSLTKVRNLRGNIPQNATAIGGSCFQQASALTVAGIANWNTISSVQGFWPHCGDQINGCENMSYAQDFMKNNRGLTTINATQAAYYQAGYRDTTFKLSRLKSDWNTYFANLGDIEISDEHWNREDLSGLTHLSTFVLVAGNQNHSNNATGNTITPIPASVTDTIINQIWAGGGQNMSNGFISILTGGTGRTAASQTAVNALIAKHWTIVIDGVTQVSQ